MNVHLGWHFIYARQYDEALTQLRKAVEADPNCGLAYWYSGLAYEQKGMYDDALREMRRARQLLPENVVIESDIGHLYAVAGRVGEGVPSVSRIEGTAVSSAER